MGLQDDLDITSAVTYTQVPDVPHGETQHQLCVYSMLR